MIGNSTIEKRYTRNKNVFSYICRAGSK